MRIIQWCWVATELFFLEVAKKTQRLNAVAVGRVASDKWKLSKTMAGLFGKSMAGAYNTCMQAGKKATNGEKLSEVVVEIYNAACGSTLKCKQEVKREKISIKQELKQVKTETPQRKLKREDSDAAILSPGRLTALYGGGVPIKEMFFLAVAKRANVLRTFFFTGACAPPQAPKEQCSSPPTHT